MRADLFGLSQSCPFRQENSGASFANVSTSKPHQWTGCSWPVCGLVSVWMFPLERRFEKKCSQGYGTVSSDVNRTYKQFGACASVRKLLYSVIPTSFGSFGEICSAECDEFRWSKGIGNNAAYEALESIQIYSCELGVFYLIVKPAEVSSSNVRTELNKYSLKCEIRMHNNGNVNKIQNWLCKIAAFHLCPWRWQRDTCSRTSQPNRT